MKNLNFAGETYKAESIVKTSSGIIGYIGDNVVFKFSGVSDFSGFALEDGQEFDAPELSLVEQFEQLKQEKDQLAETLDMVLTDLIPTLLLGGE